MSAKQDRTYARTAQDLERKYQFGKTFADMLGLINDNRDKVDEVESSLRNEITKSSTTLRRDTEKIVMEVQKEIAKGAERVVTKTGYEFSDEGLNISKSGEQMSNRIDHTGMQVKRGDEEILSATNKGVDATNLHAKTYLIIGEDDGLCRFEKYNNHWVGCFWLK
jgi:hypothetical protein